MMGLMNFKTIAAAAVIAAATASSAVAATYYYGTYTNTQPSINLGPYSQATLDVIQDGSNVVFTLTNTLTNKDGPMSGDYYESARISALGLTYTGNNEPTQAYDKEGVLVSEIKTKGESPGGAGGGLISIDFATLFPTSGSTLTYGLFAKWTFYNVLLADFDFSPFMTSIHIIGVPVAEGGTQSTKYTTGVVPLPASLPLLLGGIGLLGFAGRRRKAATA